MWFLWGDEIRKFTLPEAKETLEDAYSKAIGLPYDELMTCPR